MPTPTDETKKAECKLLGIFPDPLVTRSWDSTDVKLQPGSAVDEVVGTVYYETAKRASAAYNLDPPIDPNTLTAMLIPGHSCSPLIIQYVCASNDCLSDTLPKQKVSDVGSELVVVIQPGDTDQGRLRNKAEHGRYLESKNAELERELLSARAELVKERSGNKGNKGMYYSESFCPFS